MQIVEKHLIYITNLPTYLLINVKGDASLSYSCADRSFYWIALMFDFSISICITLNYISEKPNGCKGGYNVCYNINYSSDQGRIYPCSDQVYDALFYILYTS